MIWTRALVFLVILGGFVVPRGVCAQSATSHPHEPASAQQTVEPQVLAPKQVPDRGRAYRRSGSIMFGLALGSFALGVPLFATQPSGFAHGVGTGEIIFGTAYTLEGAMSFVDARRAQRQRRPSGRWDRSYAPVWAFTGWALATVAGATLWAFAPDGDGKGVGAAYVANAVPWLALATARLVMWRRSRVSARWNTASASV